MGGLPAVRVVVDVEVEAGDLEAAVEAGELVEGAVQQRVAEVVGDRHVRVVREGEVDRERARGAPRRRAARSCEIPSATLTNTTGETGRKVPVPRRCTRKPVVRRRDLRRGAPRSVRSSSAPPRSAAPA